MIKKLLIVLMIFVVITPFFSGYAKAQDIVVYRGYVTQSITVSEGPGSGFDIIGSLNPWDEVIVVSPGNVWHMIRFNGNKGYIKADGVGKLYFDTMDESSIFTGPKTSVFIDEPIVSKSKSPYYIIIDKAKQMTTVLIRGDSGDFDTIYRQMVSSTGRTPGRTPLGLFTITSRKLDWLYSAGYKVFMQNDVQFNNRIYFHSPAYSGKDRNTMVSKTYYDLGEPVSAGCVRLTTSDSVWIRENSPVGTKVLVIKSGGPQVVDLTIIPYLPSGQMYDPTEDKIEVSWLGRNRYSSCNSQKKFLMD